MTQMGFGKRVRRKMTVQHRPFRFGIFSHNTSPSKQVLVDQARKAERIGYSTFLVPDHLGDQFSSVLALAMTASATSSLRIGSFVFDNDFRHPVLLAKDAATLDVLSDGRFEFGLGAGWMRLEYEQAGMKFDTAGIRISRMEEALHIIKSLLTGSPLTFSGNYYSVIGLSGLPQPIQRPHPPIFIGGSGKRMLSLAAREADIVGFAPKTRAARVETHMNDTLDMTDAMSEALAQKVEWVRQSAGDHFFKLELNIVVLDVVVTPNRQLGAEQLATRYGVKSGQVLTSPHFLIGSVDQICQDIWARREQYGFSYIVVWEEHLESFAPVVARLANK